MEGKMFDGWISGVQILWIIRLKKGSELITVQLVAAVPQVENS